MSKYRISRWVPVPMKSTFRASISRTCPCCGVNVGMMGEGEASDYTAETGDRTVPRVATWWQWRGRVFRHRQVIAL